MEKTEGLPGDVEVARHEMHVTIDNLDAAKRAYAAGTGTLADINAAADKTHEATDRYFDAMRSVSRSANQSQLDDGPHGVE